MKVTEATDVIPCYDIRYSFPQFPALVDWVVILHVTTRRVYSEYKFVSVTMIHCLVMMHVVTIHVLEDTVLKSCTHNLMLL